MARPRRNAAPDNILSPARTFFATTKTSQGRALLQSERNATLMINVLRSYVAAGKFRLHDFVIMPDHIHLLLTVDGDMTIEKAMQFIKGGFSYRLKKETGYLGDVWQPGFSEVRVEDRRSFLQHREYIAQNPVEADLVDSSEKLSNRIHTRSCVFEILCSMAACPQCYYPITKRAPLFESDYICPHCKQRLAPELSSVLLSILLLLGIPNVTMGLFAFVFGVDSTALIIGFFVLLPFGIYAGGTVIRYEPRPEEPVVNVPIQVGANRLGLYARLLNDARAVSAVIRQFRERYTRGNLS
jgi:putative transposase